MRAERRDEKRGIPNSIGVIRFLVKARDTDILAPHVLLKDIAPTSSNSRVLTGSRPCLFLHGHQSTSYVERIIRSPVQYNALLPSPNNTTPPSLTRGACDPCVRVTSPLSLPPSHGPKSIGKVNNSNEVNHTTLLIDEQQYKLLNSTINIWPLTARHDVY